MTLILLAPLLVVGVNDLLQTQHAILRNYPVIGHDAFRTATGVHAAAIVKAFHSNPALADTYERIVREAAGPSREARVCSPASTRSR